MKKSFVIGIVVVCSLIGLLLALHLKSDFPVQSNFPADELQARQELLKDFLDEQGYLQSRIVSLRGEIEEAQSDIENQTAEVNLGILDGLKKSVGLTEVNGAGVEILLDDSRFAIREGVEAQDIELIQASDLRDVVNLLNAAHAEAISINNQRVLATSAIVSVGSSILVNDTYVTPPFAIEAVGSTDLMLQRIFTENLLPSLYDRQKRTQLVFKISRKAGISVPVYNGDLKTNYINLVE